MATDLITLSSETLMRIFRSGIVALDQLLVSYGIPAGSLVEVHGPPDSGKTAVGLQFVRTLLETDPAAAAAWLTTESPLRIENLRWAQIEAHQERFFLLEAPHPTPTLLYAATAVEAGAELVVIDSMTAAVGASPEDPLPMVLSQGLPVLKAALEEHQAIGFLLNQERTQPGRRGSSHAGASPALVRLVDVRIRVRASTGLYRAGVPHGVRIEFVIAKDGPDAERWGKTGSFALEYETGVRDFRRHSEEERK